MCQKYEPLSVTLFLKKQEFNRKGEKVIIGMSGTDAVQINISPDTQGYKDMFEFILENIDNLKGVKMNLIQQNINLDLRTLKERHFDETHWHY